MSELGGAVILLVPSPRRTHHSPTRYCERAGVISLRQRPQSFAFWIPEETRVDLRWTGAASHRQIHLPLELASFPSRLRNGQRQLDPLDHHCHTDLPHACVIVRTFR
jgi:hypothetical protein